MVGTATHDPQLCPSGGRQGLAEPCVPADAADTGGEDDATFALTEVRTGLTPAVIGRQMGMGAREQLAASFAPGDRDLRKKRL
jgi:hypothetical protein